MKITLPELSLVVLIGPSGAGKSSFAHRHFRPTEVLSSDTCRGLVSDDENAQDATNDAFEVLHFIAAKRLGAGRLTVIDATNVQPEARKPLVALARRYHCLPVAIVLDLPERLCHERNHARPDRGFGPHVVRQQVRELRRSLRGLAREGFRHVYVLRDVAAVDAAVVERQPLWNDRRHDHGPFDIVGDVHGCLDELEALLARLGYRREGAGPLRHPDGRKAVFLGDLVDRGPAIPGVLRLVMEMVEVGTALCVPGNHEMKLLKKLRGKDVKLSHGLAETLAQLEAEPRDFGERVAAFIDDLVSHYVLDDGKLVVAHAGMKAELQGRGSAVVRNFALYGETTGETDEFGLPVRYDWASEYRGKAMVIYGHTPVPEPEWLNNTLCIDTGCVFGGRLTALRYPERELASVPAARVYCEPAKPLALARPTTWVQPAAEAAGGLTAQQLHDDLLDMEDVRGKRIIATRLGRQVTIREAHGAAALEAMSRFAADPHWLIYLPPTMSPPETSRREGLLEHPAEAFDYFRAHGVERVVCEEKHMGSRAVIVLCRDEAAARRRFGVTTGEAGLVYTRTGRRFFGEARLEAALLERLRAAVTAAGLWEELGSDWLCLDCELLPWSLKAEELVRSQYAAVGAAAQAALMEAEGVLAAAVATGAGELGELLGLYRERAELVGRYRHAYRRYCWTVERVDDLRVAPFHLLASEGAVHAVPDAGRDHLWHLGMLARLAAGEGSLVLATRHQVVELGDAASCEAAIAWWEALTTGGGEGMVVKPLEFVARGPQGLVQPAVKVRGREYLRIIYGPDYTLPEHLERLRSRGLAVKRSLALREFALGLEALERFVRREPLRRVHECVFGVLALESEPVDPRL